MRRSKAPSSLAFKKPTSISADSKPMDTKKDNDAESKEDEDKEEDTNTPSSSNDSTVSIPKPISGKSSFKTPFKTPTAGTTTASKPSNADKNKGPPAVSGSNTSTEEAGESTYFMIMWTNYSTKKHKTYNDGINFFRSILISN